MVQLIKNQTIPPKCNYQHWEDFKLALKFIKELQPIEMFDGDCIEMDFPPDAIQQWLYRNMPHISITIRQVNLQRYRIWRKT